MSGENHGGCWYVCMEFFKGMNCLIPLIIACSTGLKIKKQGVKSSCDIAILTKTSSYNLLWNN